MSLSKVPNTYVDGWFQLDKAVPCWINFATEKSCRLTMTCRSREFKVTVKPGVRYAARMLFINLEQTFASIEFPEFEGFVDGLDLSFAVPTFPSEVLSTPAELADTIKLLSYFSSEMEPVAVELVGKKLVLKPAY